MDAVAAVYDESLHEQVVRHYNEKRANLARQCCPAGGRILDAGCGTGNLTIELVRRGDTSVFGLDESFEMVRLGCSKGATDCVCARIQDMPFRDETFDVVICAAVLHHVADPGSVAFSIREMARVTKPGGVFILWDHNPWNPYWKVIMRQVPQDTGEERLIRASELMRDARNAGAREIELVRSGFVPNVKNRGLFRAFRAMERILERLPVVGAVLAHNIVIARK